MKSLTSLRPRENKWTGLIHSKLEKNLDIHKCLLEENSLLITGRNPIKIFDNTFKLHDLEQIMV